MFYCVISIELAFEVGLYPNSHSKMVLESILDPLTDHPSYYPHTKSKSSLSEKGCIGKNPSPVSAKDKAKIKYISGGQPSSHELVFGVELGPNSHSKMVLRARFFLREE